MGLFDSAPDEQRRRVLDFLASKSGAPDSLVRPPEQADPVPPEAAPPAAPMAAPPPAPAPEPLHDAAHDRASMMAALERAQQADEAGRASLVRKMALARFLGNGMSPEQIQLAQPRGVQNLMQGHELGSHLDTEGRAAQEFPYKLRGEAAKAGQEEATAALTGAKVPYAGAEAAADARMKGSHADLFEQQATKGKADLAESERLRTDEWDPNGVATQVARQILESTGQKAPPGPYAAWKHLLPEAVKLHVADKAAEAARSRIDTTSGARETKRTDDLAKRLSQALDPYARGGGLKGSMDIVNRAKRLKTLVLDEKGQPRNLDRRQMEEVAIGLNSLLSGSSSGAQSQVEALVPHTIWGDVKKLQERISNEPTGLDQGKFVSRLLETIEREEGVTQKTVKEAIRARLPEFSPLKDLDSSRYTDILRARGLDPELLDDAGGGKGGAAAADPVVRPRRTMNGETREWDGSAWVPVKG